MCMAGVTIPAVTPRYNSNKIRNALARLPIFGLRKSKPTNKKGLTNLAA
jgi:hypothetical protein